MQSRAFSEMLKKAMNAYRNRAIATHEIIEELTRQDREMQEAANRGDDLGLSEEEVCFYDALTTNQSAVKVIGVGKLVGAGGNW